MQEHELKKILKQLEDKEKRIKELENRQPTVTYTDNEYAGVLVTFPDGEVGKFIIVEITANGYNLANPTKTLVQAFHYQSKGTFIAQKQSNLSGNLEACSFGILNDKVVLWIPRVAPFSTYIISSHAVVNNFNSHTATLQKTKPEIQNEIKCQIVS